MKNPATNASGTSYFFRALRLARHEITVTIGNSIIMAADFPIADSRINMRTPPMSKTHMSTRAKYSSDAFRTEEIKLAGMMILQVRLR